MAESALTVLYLGAERLREAARRLANETLKIFHNRRREVEFISLLQEARFVEVVLDHELGQVTHHFGARSHLNDVTKQPVTDTLGESRLARAPGARKPVGLRVGLLDGGPLMGEAERVRLEVKVCVLTARDLILVHIRAS